MLDSSNSPSEINKIVLERCKRHVKDPAAKRCLKAGKHIFLSNILVLGSQKADPISVRGYPQLSNALEESGQDIVIRSLTFDNSSQCEGVKDLDKILLQGSSAAMEYTVLPEG